MWSFLNLEFYHTRFRSRLIVDWSFLFFQIKFSNCEFRISVDHSWQNPFFWINNVYRDNYYTRTVIFETVPTKNIDHRTRLSTKNYDWSEIWNCSFIAKSNFLDHCKFETLLFLRQHPRTIIFESALSKKYGL